jgi:alanine racemase
MVEDFFEYVLVLNDFVGGVAQDKSQVCSEPRLQPGQPSQSKIRYTINDIKSIEKFPQGTKVELKVDTGMHRNGISMDEIETALKLIKKHTLKLEAVFTHHRSADELSSEWFWQNENFKEVKKRVLASGYSDIKFHSANSASLFRYDEFGEDMARVGIAAYGCMELPHPIDVEGFKPVLSLYASKISSRELKKGEHIGYGATYEADKDCVVSNYDFGYGDGFLRVCSNNFKTPHAKELVGRISMDNSSFLSDDDELLVFDDAREVAKSANTISYEVLTSLKPYIKREIV